MDPIREVVNGALGGRLLVNGGWITPALHPKRDQGWKLHVSATIRSAVTVLERVLPILVRASVPFKIAADLDCLSDLNEGAAGLGQVGKLITVYPQDDLDAVKLAMVLEQATFGLDGPRIPTDRPLRPGSLVHYRYGGFRDLQVTDSLGQIEPAIREPDGNLIADRRSPRFEPPEWATDPFELAGIIEHNPQPTTPLFGRYLILSLLNQNAKGGVYLALDPTVSPCRTCVIKEGRRHVAGDMSGRDIRDRIRQQYKLLQAFSEEPGFPKVYDLFDLEQNCYLVMDYIEGQTLRSVVSSRQTLGKHVGVSEIAALGVAIAEIVDQLHEKRLIFRDLTPTNVIVGVDDQVRLIDLELVHSLDDNNPPYGWGTRGYTSPQQAARKAPTLLDDVYSLGATLFYAATGSEPSLMGGGLSQTRCLLPLLNPGIPESLADFIAACMDPDPTRRPQDMTTAANCLIDFRQEGVTRLEQYRAPQTSVDERTREYLRLAAGAGDMLLATALRQKGGICWATTSSINQREVGAEHLPRRSLVSPNLHNGVAGTALFLANLGCRLGEHRYLNAAEEAACWLLSYRKTNGTMLPSLHFGEAGIAAFVAQLASATGDAEYLQTASEIATSISLDETDLPDLTHGWSGIGLLQLLIFELTGDEQHLELACEAGRALLATAEPIGPGLGWRHPAGTHVGMSGEILTGLAHGAAGIGYFLLELWRVTQDPEYQKLIRGTARWLGDCAEPSLADGSGCNWPLGHEPEGGTADDPNRWFHWCHGAAGITLFFLRASELLNEPEYRRLAVAGSTTTAAARFGGTVLCHGPPGNGSVLLEAYHVLRDPRWLDAAYEFGDLVALYSRVEEGGVTWPAEHTTIVTPDFMVGYSGVADFLLRLARPNHTKAGLRLPII